MNRVTAGNIVEFPNTPRREAFFFPLRCSAAADLSQVGLNRVHQIRSERMQMSVRAEECANHGCGVPPPFPIAQQISMQIRRRASSQRAARRARVRIHLEKNKLNCD
ncbi:hypothetical protein CDAR_274071 [Caerostris darwini]|uniref:Uncharacterized protein n=1 Tax=Caerostris darwini TaxID=1538125 RepID=A0AAV4RE23_9ARAC|nr:hypothetical protein CDAR_274071 [Caerostris darwini]